jgi:glycerol uptake facilitator-like aquaporin
MKSQTAEMKSQTALWRRLVAEFLGTGLLVTVVVGSGIAAQQLSPGDVGLELLENSTATALGLAVLIVMLGPLSGAHFNPIVSAADWFIGRRAGTGLKLRDLAPYVAAQIAGGILGAILSNVMFSVGTALSIKQRATGGHLVGEVVATVGLIVLVFALARAHRAAAAAPAIGAYIGAAYWFTSSTSFANPAVTVARSLTDTFAGIRPADTPGFIAAQLAGAFAATAVFAWLSPISKAVAAAVVVPHPESDAR